jgi:hypothetical protein
MGIGHTIWLQGITVWLLRYRKLHSCYKIRKETKTNRKVDTDYRPRPIPNSIVFKPLTNYTASARPTVLAAWS